MLDELRDRIIAFSSQHKICIISTSGSSGAWVTPAWHYSSGLEMVCLLPRWSDVLYHLEQNPQVMVVIPDPCSSELRWLQVRGIAQITGLPDWERVLPQRISKTQADERYVAVHITPERIDFVDENRGWGARETLDL